MKNRKTRLIGLLLLVAVAVLFTVPTFAQTATNTPPTVQTPEVLNPLLKLLSDKAGAFVTKAVLWVMTVSALLAPFAVWIRNKLANALNTAAASASGDDDVYLRKLFSNPAYRFTAFLLNFANVRLPTLAELERAIAQQREAVAKSQPVARTGP